MTPFGGTSGHLRKLLLATDPASDKLGLWSLPLLVAARMGSASGAGLGRDNSAFLAARVLSGVCGAAWIVKAFVDAAGGFEEAGDGGWSHAPKKIAVNMKRKTLPPRNAASLLGLRPCLQQSSAKARHTNVSPRNVVSSVRAIPTNNKIQPRPPAASTLVPNFVLVGFQNEYFCVR